MDENFKEIMPMWKGKPVFKKSGGLDEDCHERAAKHDPDVRNDCFLSSGATGDPATANKIALYHYATKSLQDFSEKMSRGSGMSRRSRKGMDYFAEISRCAELLELKQALHVAVPLSGWLQQACMLQHATSMHPQLASVPLPCF